MKIYSYQSRNYYRPNFGIKLVETPEMTKYIESFHFKNQQNNLRNALNIIQERLAPRHEHKYLKVAPLHPSKADFVKNGTYEEFFSDKKTITKRVSDRFERENIYMQIDDNNKTQNFYMNPDENPENLANWFMETFHFYRGSL